MSNKFRSQEPAAIAPRRRRPSSHAANAVKAVLDQRDFARSDAGKRARQEEAEAALAAAGAAVRQNLIATGKIQPAATLRDRLIATGKIQPAC